MIKVVLLSTLIITNVFAQENSGLSIDSLKYYAVNYSINDVSRYKNLEQKVKKLIEESTDNEYLFYAHSFLGEIYLKEGKYDQSLKSIFSAIEYSDQIKKLHDVAQLYDNLVVIYNKTGETDHMFHCFDKAIEIKKSINDLRGIQMNYLYLTRHYRKVGKYVEAFKIEYRALDFFESNRDTVGILISYHDIAMTYKSIGNYSKAMDIYSECFEYLEFKGFDKEKSLIYNGIGTIQLKTGNYQDALTNFLKSLKIEELLGDKQRILTRYNNIGLAYSFLHNFEPALKYFHICINEYSKSGSGRDLANLYNSLGMYYQEMNVLDSAIVYYQKSIVLGEKYNFNELVVKSTLWISKLYEIKGEIDLAYYHLTKYHKLFEDIDNSNVIWEVTVKEFEYMRQKELLIKEVERRNSILLIIIGASLFILLIFILWVILIKQKVKIHQSEIMSQKMEKRELGLNDQIKKQNQELISKILQMGDTDSEIKITIKKLEVLKSEMGVQAKYKIQQVINDLEHSTNDNIWKEFELRFIKVNPLLHEKLTSKYPDLTASERRLCALIYLNFSPMEISQITKQSYKSVLVAKSRLKSKLQINVSKDINGFLHQLLAL